MNDHILSSQCGSGCESGWTLYLEHSFLSPYPSHRTNEFSDGRRGVCRQVEENRPAKDEVEEEEEDLSMVSDASSGPPILHEDEYYGDAKNGYFYEAPIDDSTLPKNSGKRKKKKTREIRCEEEEEHPPFLDDTASSSSSIFNFSQSNFSLTNNRASVENTLDFSHGCSSTHFESNFSLTNNQASVENTLDLSHGCSSTHFEGRSASYEPFGFFQPFPGNQLQQNQWFGEKMGMRWK